MPVGKLREPWTGLRCCGFSRLRASLGWYLWRGYGRRLQEWFGRSTEKPNEMTHLTITRRRTSERVVGIAAEDIRMPATWCSADTTRGTVSIVRLRDRFMRSIDTSNTETSRGVDDLRSAAVPTSADASVGASVSPESVPKRAYPQEASQPPRSKMCPRYSRGSF